MSPLELIASLLGVIAVYLTIRQNPWGWPIGLVMVLLYAWIFFDAKLYANVGLQLFFAASQLYGWWLWTRPNSGHPLPVRRLSPSTLLLGLSLAAIGSVGLGFALQHSTDASAPWLDAGLTAFSLLAQLWMARKCLECWPLWVVVDVIYVVLFIDTALYLTAGLYALFTALALHGWWEWRRDQREQAQRA